MITLLQQLFREYGAEQSNALRLRVRAMGTHAVPALLPSLRATEQAERIWAVKLLGDIGDESALPVLLQALQNQKLELLERPYYVEAIARFSSADAIAMLQQLQDDPDTKVQRIALRALERQKDTLKTIPKPNNNSLANNNSSLTDAEFLRLFESATLPKKQWTHEAHLRMAYLYLRQTPNIDALLPCIRERIQAYNLAQSNKNGYHETITVAFLHIVQARMRSGNAQTFLVFKAENPGIFQSTYLGRHYSEAILFAPEARLTFIPPDREPLPSA
jgi:hypothetical protein